MIIVDKKVIIGILVALIIVSGIIIYETSDNIMSYAFDQLNYNYTGYVSIPNDTEDGGSLGGTYQIRDRVNSTYSI